MSTQTAEPRTLTTYTVFEQREDGSLFPVGSAEGNTDINAVKSVVSQLALEEGTFVAVPVRSIRPRTVKVETNPRVRIG